MMTNWADRLIDEYKGGRETLEFMQEKLTDSEYDCLDRTQKNSMIDSMTYSIDCGNRKATRNTSRNR